ncbi:MAG: polysulfide reductase [Desulfosporosinus sp. BRH_c37]|nr:MAG: polysulfide reductase [Desulfosporosinus sp. BRH_c37]
MKTVHFFATETTMYWGLMVALYFYYTGLSAGVLLISSLGSVFGIDTLRKAAKMGAVIALSLLVIAPIHLILDLEKPTRFITLLGHFQATSAMSWGAYILVLYGIALAMYTYNLFRGEPKNSKSFGIAAFVLALAVEGYTGFLMGNIQSHALWNTPLMPVIFLFSALVSGTAFLIIAHSLLEKVLGNQGDNVKAANSLLKNWLKWFILVDGALMVIYFIVLWSGHTDQYATAYLLLHKESFSFFWLENVVGLLIPFLILIYRPLAEKKAATLLASVLVVLGVFLMRYNLVVDGQRLPLAGNTLLEYHASSAEVTAALILALVGVAGIVLLLKVLPANQGNFSGTSKSGKEAV